MAEKRSGNVLGNEPVTPKLVERKTYTYGNGSTDSWVERWWCDPPALEQEYVVLSESWSPDYTERDIRVWRPVAG